MVNKKVMLKLDRWLVLCLLITCFLPNTLKGQLINNNNWFFGNSTQALLFNKSDTMAVIEENIRTATFGTGGSAVISNEDDGNLLFYSDGATVYDATHIAVPDGTGLTGDPSLNQAVAAIPIDGGGNTSWYFFTNSGSLPTNEIQYTRVDINSPPGNANQPGQPNLGDVFVDKNIATGLINPAPGMLILRSTTIPNSSEFWLLSQERVTGEFRVTQVIGTSVIGTTNNFTDAMAPPIVAENFAAFQQDSIARIAMSPQNANSNVQIWELNTNTGVLSFSRQILNSGNGDDVLPSIYDTEWSPDGTKLYISRQGSSGVTGNLLQFDFNDSLQNVNTILPAPVFRSFGIRRGPNDTIYHLYQPTAAAAIQLGAINVPNQVFDSVEYQLDPFPNDNFNGMQFPEFSQPTRGFAMVDFTFQDSCFNLATKFSPDVDPAPLRYFWDFGDGATSTSQSPIHTYAAAGAYNVTLTVELEEAVDQMTRTVQIIDSGIMIQLPNDTTLCLGESLPLDPMPMGGTPVSTLWNTQETTSTITVDQIGVVDPGGTYWVSVEAAAGCEIFDEIQLTVYEQATQISNQWYFGDMAGIDFTLNMAVTDGVSQSPEAATTFSDTNGDLLFYSNGVTVYNQDHVRMINGASIGGDSTSAQGALIVQLPEDETLYYVFTTDPAWGDQTFDLRYATIDLKEDTARGAVELKSRPVYSRSTERLTASGFGTNGNVWLVSHEFGNNTFRSYPIDTAGIGAPVFSSVGTILSPAIEGHSRNYMKIVGTQLAMTISDPDVPGDNFVEVFDFDGGTGELSNPRKININEPAPSEVYGVEISGDRLYVTTRGASGSKLIQFTIDTTDVAVIEASKFEVPGVNEELGAIETAPDGTIYIATNGLASLASIGSPTGDPTQVSYNVNGIDLAGRLSTLGLPNFVNNSNSGTQTPSMSVMDGCVADSLQFAATPTDNSIDMFQWTFGDGNSSTDQNPQHAYTLAGTYGVRLVISNRCVGTVLDSTATVTIGETPPDPTTPTAAAICNGSLTLEALDAATLATVPDPSVLTYEWSTGETTNQITVTQPASISVTVVDSSTGCRSQTIPILVVPAIDFDLGPPITVCGGETINPLTTGFAAAAPHQWTVDGVPMSTTPFQDIETSTAGVFEYRVTVTDPAGNCSSEDFVTVTVLELPDITLTPTITTGCGAADGQVDVTFPDGSFTYDFVFEGTTTMSGFFAGPGTLNIPGLVGGSYALNATNSVTGCQRSVSTNITDFGVDFNILLTPQPGCGSNGAIDVDVSTGANPPTDYSYTVTNSSGQVVETNTLSGVTNFTVMGLDSGTYNVTVRRTMPIPACVNSVQTPLPELDPAEIDIDPIVNFCGTSGVLAPTVTPSVSVLWTFPDAVTTSTDNPLTVTQPGVYTVVSEGATAANLCPRTEMVEVRFNENPNVSIDIMGELCDGMRTLTAVTDNPNGSNFFMWNTGAFTSTIDVTQTDTYTVTNTNLNTGCEVSVSEDVAVEPLLELFIALEQDCDNNPNVFLNAVSNITADVIFEWIDPFGNTLPDTTAIISADTSGVYQARVIRTASGCDASATFDVTIQPIEDEELILPAATTICELDPTTATTTLDASAFNTYEWRLLPDETIIATSQTLTVNLPGEYEVTVSNGFSCTRQSTLVVEDCTPRIFAPNAFTPNGDGLNDTFFVFNNPFVTDFQIWIYNRWGELIFQANTLDFRWDGVFLGEISSVGTYAWVARFRSRVEPELGEIEEHGAVTLIR